MLQSYILVPREIYESHEDLFLESRILILKSYSGRLIETSMVIRGDNNPYFYIKYGEFMNVFGLDGQDTTDIHFQYCNKCNKFILTPYVVLERSIIERTEVCNQGCACILVMYVI